MEKHYNKLVMSTQLQNCGEAKNLVVFLPNQTNDAHQITNLIHDLHTLLCLYMRTYISMPTVLVFYHAALTHEYVHKAWDLKLYSPNLNV